MKGIQHMEQSAPIEGHQMGMMGQEALEPHVFMDLDPMGMIDLPSPMDGIGYRPILRRGINGAAIGCVLYRRPDDRSVAPRGRSLARRPSEERTARGYGGMHFDTGVGTPFPLNLPQRRGWPSRWHSSSTHHRGCDALLVSNPVQGGYRGRSAI